MAKKTIEEKIREVSFWTFIFLISYLIIGYLLQSNWLHKSLEFTRLYELLKDSLSITAALLAPVAAFVLFSDWRLQHREITTEHNTSNILSLINRLYWELTILNKEINSIDKNDKNYSKEIYKKIENCRLKNSDLVIEFAQFCHKEITNNGFTDLSGKIITSDFPDFLIKVVKHFSLINKIASPEDYLSKNDSLISIEDFINKCEIELKNNQIGREMDLKIISANIIRLSKLKDDLKV